MKSWRQLWSNYSEDLSAFEPRTAEFILKDCIAISGLSKETIARQFGRVSNSQKKRIQVSGLRNLLLVSYSNISLWMNWVGELPCLSQQVKADRWNKESRIKPLKTMKKQNLLQHSGRKPIISRTQIIILRDVNLIHNNNSLDNFDMNEVLSKFLTSSEIRKDLFDARWHCSSSAAFT